MPPTRKNRAPSASSFTDWVAQSTTDLLGILGTEKDEWKKQLAKRKISAAELNKPFTQVLRERNGYDCPEIYAFMDWSASYENETSCVEAFCQGADRLLLEPEVPTQDQQLVHVEEPRAWVSDRNYWLHRDDPTGTSLYGNVLGRTDFYNVLQKEVCAISSTGRGYRI